MKAYILVGIILALIVLGATLLTWKGVLTGEQYITIVDKIIYFISGYYLGILWVVWARATRNITLAKRRKSIMPFIVAFLLLIAVTLGLLEYIRLTVPRTEIPALPMLYGLTSPSHVSCSP